jgi:hypothetical protein
MNTLRQFIRALKRGVRQAKDDHGAQMVPQDIRFQRLVARCPLDVPGPLAACVLGKGREFKFFYVGENKGDFLEAAKQGFCAVGVLAVVETGKVEMELADSPTPESRYAVLQLMLQARADFVTALSLRGVQAARA